MTPMGRSARPLHFGGRRRDTRVNPVSYTHAGVCRAGVGVRGLIPSFVASAIGSRLPRSQTQGSAATVASPTPRRPLDDGVPEEGSQRDWKTVPGNTGTGAPAKALGLSCRNEREWVVCRRRVSGHLASVWRRGPRGRQMAVTSALGRRALLRTLARGPVRSGKPAIAGEEGDPRPGHRRRTQVGPP